MEGERTALIVPIQAWEQLLAWYQQTAKYKNLKRDLTTALSEAKAIEAEQVPKRNLQKLKAELLQTR